jgi:DNA recombination protein RmuC
MGILARPDTKEKYFKQGKGETMELVVLTIICLALGASIAWLITNKILRGHYKSKTDELMTLSEGYRVKIHELEASLTELRASTESTRLDAERRASLFEGQASGYERTIAELKEQNKAAAFDFNTLRQKLEDEQSFRIKSETEVKEIRIRLEEEKKLLGEAETKLTDAFKALAGDTLSSANKTFLELAKETFGKMISETKGDLGKQQEAVGGLVKPILDSLKQFEEHVRGIEISRGEAYASLKAHIQHLTESEQRLQKETGNLVTALRTPQVRGRWGEVTLKRVVELAGMSEHCDFTEQLTISTGDSTLRPDLIVHFPGGREIVVDSKVSLDAYLRSISAESDEQRQMELLNHARQIKTHMAQLGSKAYWQQLPKTPEFVVMFIPGESFLAAAADMDHKLIEDGMERGVVLATPTILIAVLHAVAYGWRQEQIEKNAQELRYLGRNLYDRMSKMVEHIGNIGKGLAKANESYDKAVRSFESRVLPAARRFKELGAVTSSDIPILEPVDKAPIELPPPE